MADLYEDRANAQPGGGVRIRLASNVAFENCCQIRSARASHRGQHLRRRQSRRPRFLGAALGSSGGTGGLERGDRCGGGRRQRWPQQFRGHQRLRNHRRSRQQPLCHHSRRDETRWARLRAPTNTKLQLEGPDVVRSRREARSGGAGESHQVRWSPTPERTSQPPIPKTTFRSRCTWPVAGTQLTGTTS